MFQSNRKPKSGIGTAIAMAELIYHSVVRNVRKQHNNALIAIAMNMLQTVMFVVAFYVMFSILGMRGSAVRGDFLVYLMSGIFLYLTHVKALGAVAASEGPASPMMQHAPMNTIIPITIDQPIAAFGMLLTAWFTGCALGLVMLAIKPWFPSFVTIFSTIYQRANMIASGKMFLANSLPGYMLAMFDWNPLFHSIDQARGFAFINYNPRYSNWEYPLWVGLVLLMIGLMGEFYTRRHASISWNARR